jgi:hypothetical protein
MQVVQSRRHRDKVASTGAEFVIVGALTTGIPVR